MPLPKRVVEPVRVTRNIKILQKSSSNTPNVLETTINGTLVNTLCQLSNLSKQAEDLFDELINEIHSITVRSNSLRINLDRLSAKTHLLNNNRTNEKVSLQDIEMIKPFKSAVVFDHEILSRNTMPAKLLEMYSKCDKTPLLNKIDHYRVDGKESMKFYSDPNFFFDQWRLEISKDTEILRQDSIRRCYRLNTEGAACIRRPINSRNRKEQLAIEKGEYIMSQDAYRFWAFRQITDTFYNHPIRQNDYQFAKSMDVILSKFGIRGGDAEKSKETHSLSKNNNSSDSCLVKNVTSGQKLSFKKLSNPNKNFPFYTKPLLPAEITVSRVSFSHSTTIPPPSSLPLILDRPPSPKQKMPLVSKCSPLQSDQMAFIKSLPTISDTPATLTNEVQKPLARQNDSPHHLIQCITNETDDSCARARITPEAGHILHDNENTDILRDIKDGVELSGVDIIQQKEQEHSDDFDSNSSYYRNIEITDSDSDFPLSIKCDSDDSWSDESYTRSHDVLSTDSLTTLTSECSWSSSHEALSIPSPSLIENNFYFIEPFPERFPSQRSVSIKSHLPLENFPPPPPPSFLLMLDSLMALANKPSKSSSKQKLSSNHVTQSEPTFDEEPLTNINDGDLRTFDNIGHVAHTEILPPPFAYRSSPTSLESIRNASELSSMFTTLNNEDITSLPEQRFHNHVVQSEPIIDLNTTLTWNNISSIDERNNSEFQSLTTRAEFLPQPPSMFDTRSVVNDGVIISPPEQYLPNRTIESEPNINVNTTVTNISSYDVRETPGTDCFAELEELLSSLTPLPRTSSSSPLENVFHPLSLPPSMFDTPTMSSNDDIILPPVEYLSDPITQSESTLRDANTTVTNISSSGVRKTLSLDDFAELTELLSSLTSLPRTSSSSSLPSVFDTPTMSSNENIVAPQVECLSDRITQSESTQRDMNTTATNISSNDLRQTPGTDHFAEFTELLSSFTPLLRTSSSSSLPSVFDTPTMSSNENKVSPQVECLSDRITQSESTQRDVNTIVTKISSNDLRETPGTDHFAEFTELLSSFTPLPRTSSSSSLPSMFDTPTMSSNDDNIIPPPVEYLSDRITQSESSQRDAITTVTNTNSSDVTKTLGLDDLSLHIGLLEAFLDGVKIKDFEKLKF